METLHLDALPHTRTSPHPSQPQPVGVWGLAVFATMKCDKCVCECLFPGLILLAFL
jgi:hypothetical protein